MGTGGSYQYGKIEIASYIHQHLPRHAKILDVGAGCGTYGYYLANYHYTIDAVELWQESVDVLRSSPIYHTVYQQDIRDFEYSQKYDLIIFGDILEHLTVEDAQRVLTKAQMYAKAILIAVPYLYEQGAFYGNEAERHLQPDLTFELFNERYPGYTCILGNEYYGYFYKILEQKEKFNMDHKICIYAICKNELQFVDKWLDSMSEADYIVVLDTGSTDGTYEALLNDSRVTRVEQEIITPWRFDVARNRSMELIPEDADILMCTDFDEWLEPGWAQVLRDNWKEDTTRVFYTYAWSHTSTGDPSDIFMYDKIHTRDYHWVYPVHEVLMSIDPDFQQQAINVGEAIYLHHFQDKSKARGSYFDLLKLSVEENPDDSHVRMLYAREFLIRDDWEGAKEAYQEVLAMPDIDTEDKQLVLLESLGRMAQIHNHFKEYENAIMYAQEFLQYNDTYREPYMELATAYLGMGLFTLAEAAAKAGLEYSTQKATWVERSDSWNGELEALISRALFNLGKYDEAIQYNSQALKYAPDDVARLSMMNLYLQTKLDKLQAAAE